MARDFTGSPNDLSAADSAAWSPSGVFSVSAWCWHDANTEGAIVAKWQSSTDRSFVLRVPTTRVLTLNILNVGGGGSSASKSGFTENAWHQVGFWMDASNNINVILDGVAGTSGTSGSALRDSTVSVRIGSSASDTTKRYWDGAICEVGAWSAQLSVDEWGALAKGVAARMIRPGSIVSYVPLWGVGAGEPDLSGQGNNFQVNGTLNPRDQGPVGSPFPVSA